MIKAYAILLLHFFRFTLHLFWYYYRNNKTIQGNYYSKNTKCSGVSSCNVKKRTKNWPKAHSKTHTTLHVASISFRFIRKQYIYQDWYCHAYGRVSYCLNNSRNYWYCKKKVSIIIDWSQSKNYSWHWHKTQAAHQTCLQACLAYELSNYGAIKSKCQRVARQNATNLKRCRLRVSFLYISRKEWCYVVEQ